MHMFMFLAVLVVNFLFGFAFIGKFGGQIIVHGTRGGASTSLYAHHVNKKITKRMMDRRPKKSRPSDIFRNNVNHDKCITKLAGSPSDYTLIQAEDCEPGGISSLQFWMEGDPHTPWLEITAEDESNVMCANTEAPPAGTRRQKPPLMRSGTH